MPRGMDDAESQIAQGELISIGKGTRRSGGRHDPARQSGEVQRRIGEKIPLFMVDQDVTFRVNLPKPFDSGDVIQMGVG